MKTIINATMRCGRKSPGVYDLVHTPLHVCSRGSWVTAADAESSVFGVPAAEAAVPWGQDSKS